MSQQSNFGLADLPTSFWTAWTSRTTVIRALKVAVVIGTVLIAINQGDIIMTGNTPPVWKIALTYLVPYSVSSYSTAAFLRELLLFPRDFSSFEARE